MRKTVMASGHFDPFHPGHVNYLLAAKALGDSLVVAVDSDDALSAKHPPILCAGDRVALVGSLSFVDHAILCVGEDASDVLKHVRPNVYAVGPDHADVTGIPEYPTCVELGVEVVALTRLKKEVKGSAIAKAKMVYSNRPTVVNAIIMRNGKPLVGVRNSEDGFSKSELIGGFVEPGETLEQALRREVREETTAEVVKMEYFGSWPGQYSDGRILLSVVFVCELDREPVATEEVREFKPVDEVPVNMFAQCDADALGSFIKGLQNEDFVRS